jgi:hypothetical protein
MVADVSSLQRSRRARQEEGGLGLTLDISLSHHRSVTRERFAGGACTSSAWRKSKILDNCVADQWSWFFFDDGNTFF